MRQPRDRDDEDDHRLWEATSFIPPKWKKVLVIRGTLLGLGLSALLLR